MFVAVPFPLGSRLGRPLVQASLISINQRKVVKHPSKGNQQQGFPNKVFKRFHSLKNMSVLVFFQGGQSD